MKCKHTDTFHFVDLQIEKQMLDYHDLQRTCDLLSLAAATLMTHVPIL